MCGGAVNRVCLNATPLPLTHPHSQFNRGSSILDSGTTDIYLPAVVFHMNDEETCYAKQADTIVLILYITLHVGDRVSLT